MRWKSIVAGTLGALGTDLEWGPSYFAESSVFLSRGSGERDANYSALYLPTWVLCLVLSFAGVSRLPCPRLQDPAACLSTQVLGGWSVAAAVIPGGE